MTRTKLYVGVSVAQFAGENVANNSPYIRSQSRQVFRSETMPTIETHGAQFNYVIGPFRTKRGADFMARFGAGNPHCQTVSECEEIARRSQS